MGSTLDQSTLVTSRWFGTPGQRAASTFDGSSSHSQCHTVLPPKNSSTARSRPPTPENKDPTRRLIAHPRKGCGHYSRTMSPGGFST